MALTALLFAHHGAGPDGEPHAVRRIAGTTLIERQARLARRHGATRVRVAVERMPPKLAAALLRADVEVVRTGVGFAVARDESVLVIADSLEADDRLISATLAKHEPALAVWKGRAAHDGAERIDPATHWAGVAVYPGAMVAETLADLGEWDLQATLLRAAFAGERPSKVDAGAIGGAPLIWQAVRGDDDAARLTAIELEAGRETHPDAVERLLRPVEAQLVARLVEAQTRPHLIVLASIVLGLAGVFGFAAGWTIAGLVAAILSSALVPVGPALARMRHEPSPPAWPALAVEAGWHAALGATLSRPHGGVAALALLLLIVGGRGGALAGGAIYRRATGQALPGAGPFEQRLSMLGASRNTLLWALIPFGVAGAWWAGFAALGAYAFATQAIVLWRVHRRLPAQR